MTSALTTIRRAVWDRAQGRCEATYPGGSGRYRCLNPADELHHAMPRGRGGRLLDRAAERAVRDGSFDRDRHLAHLLALCFVCHHDVAHGQPLRAREARLILPGHVISHFDGAPLYVGADPVLSRLWREDAA